MTAACLVVLTLTLAQLEDLRLDAIRGAQVPCLFEIAAVIREDRK